MGRDMGDVYGAGRRGWGECSFPSRRVNPCEQIPGHNEAYWGLEVAPESKTCLKHLVVQQPTLLCAGNRFTQHSKCLALGSTNILSVPTAICCFSLLDRCTY